MVIASFLALILLLHNFTWFIIGVVMAPTYILLILACVCLGVNFWAIADPASMSQLLRQLPKALIPLGRSLKPKTSENHHEFTSQSSNP
jgi:Flp pilus assembly protein TadB